MKRPMTPAELRALYDRAMESKSEDDAHALWAAIPEMIHRLESLWDYATDVRLALHTMADAVNRDVPKHLIIEGYNRAVITELRNAGRDDEADSAEMFLRQHQGGQMPS